MCISKKAIDVVGDFDEKSFPKGYGEEDDFCIRARNHGFKNVIATSVYIHHSKSKSFGHKTRVKLATQSRKVLDKKYGEKGYKLLTESIGNNPAINSKRECIQDFIKPFAYRHSVINEEIAQVDTVKDIGTAMSPKICIHLHLHYTNMADYFSSYLTKMPCEFDLYLTLNEKTQVEPIINHFKNNVKLGKITTDIYSNQGRDIYPFLKTIGKVYKQYDYVLHIHSKKSIHNPLFGSQWLNHLMSHLLFNKAYIQNLLYIMETENVGLLYPPVLEELYPNYKWGKNKGVVKKLFDKIGVQKSVLDSQKLSFPAGNMFWANTSSLSKLFDEKIKLDEFPPEPIEIDGTLAHALERAFSYIVNDAGYKSLIVEPVGNVTFLNEIKMFKERTLSHQEIETTILKKLELKQPFALVRFFDGEGAFYKADTWSNNFLQERMKYYFGKKEYSKSEALFIKDMILSSLNTADLIGIPNLDIVEEMLEFAEIYADRDIEKLPSIRRRYNDSIDCNSAWRILSSFQLVINALNEKKSFCTKDIHYEMLLNGSLYRILDSVSKINIITSQPVKEHLEKLFKLKVNQFSIPKRALDNDTLKATNHYPDVYKSILERLENKKTIGALFLVGAGPLGKAYCEKIRSCGGIALDIGAIFDSWINFHTRPEHTDESRSFNKKLLLTSKNIFELTDGAVNPSFELSEKGLPKKKINKYLRS